jgi:hypothetical protein
MESKEISTLRNIFTILDNLTNEAFQNRNDFRGDAINWGDFECISLTRSEELELCSPGGEVDSHTRYVALFSEAAPNEAPKFKNWIENEILTRYGYDIDVEFEW